jgi:hypothetical protein
MNLTQSSARSKVQNIKNFLIALRLAIVLFLPSMTSCSALIVSRGKNVIKYQEHPEHFSREQVLAYLGPPIKTERIDPPKAMKSLEGHRSMTTLRNYYADSRSRIAIIDEHFIKGPVFDRSAKYGAVVSKGLAVYTFGLSELYFVPAFLSCDATDRTFYTFFDTNERLVTSSLMPPDHGRSAGSSRSVRTAVPD